MRSLFSFCLIILLVSCVSERNKGSDIEILPNNAASVSIMDHVERIEIIPLETITESLLRDIKSVKFADGFIFVEDSRGGVFSFERNGGFVSQVGNRGQGPEEHLSSLAFFVDEENRHVVLIDVVKEALIKHDFYGRFQGLHRVPLVAIREVQDALLMEDGTLLLNHMIITVPHVEDIAYTALSGSYFQRRKTFFHYYPITAENYMVAFASHPMVRTSDGSVNLIMPLNDTIFNFYNGKVTPKYRVELPERRMRMAPRERFKTQIGNNFFNVMFEYGRRGFFTGFTGIFGTENIILLEYRYQGVLLGYYLFDRVSGQGGYTLYSQEPDEFPVGIVIASHDNFFVSAKDPQDLLLMKDDLRENLDPTISHNARLLEVLDNLQFDDNPVLFLYHMK